MMKRWLYLLIIGILLSIPASISLDGFGFDNENIPHLNEEISSTEGISDDGVWTVYFKTSIYDTVSWDVTDSDDDVIHYDASMFTGKKYIFGGSFE